MRNALLNCIYIYILYVSRRWRLVRPYIYIVVKRGKNWRFHGRIHDTETLFSQSRNKFARPEKGGSPSLLLQFLPRRVVRFRWCNGSLVSFPRRGGDLSRGGWRTITLHLQFHAALASSLPFPLRFFSISFPPKIPSFVALPLSLPLRPSPSPSHPSPFPKTRHDPPRNSRSFGEERERGRGGRGGGRRWPNYSGPQMIVSASFRRLRRHHPEYARLNESVTKTPGETVRFY